MIAGRRLLVADDSATIQKVVDLTFSDEGMEVTTVSDGDQAIDKLEEVAFDVVLADVFMPGRTGYEVCAAIKHNERFHNIPVMLLVGSFEPFDEAEARRVGADDVLTKPFQSIRQLVNRVGTLLGGRPAGAEAPTQRLSALGLERREEPGREGQGHDELMSTAELELTTADTLPLSEAETEPAKESDQEVDAAESFSAGSPAFDQETASWAELLATNSEPGTRDRETEQTFQVEHMNNTNEQRRAAGGADEFDDVLLDLGEFDSSPAVAFGDAILEIEEEAPATFPGSDVRAPAFEAEGFSPVSAHERTTLEDRSYETEFTPEWSGRPPRASHEYAATDGESGSGNPSAESPWQIVPRAVTFERVTDEEESRPYRDQQQPASYQGQERREPANQSGGTLYERRKSAQQGTGTISLSPDDIDAIARRVVEQISDKVVREIAWDIVPELAEILIKRRLEEEN